VRAWKGEPERAPTPWNLAQRRHIPKPRLPTKLGKSINYRPNLGVYHWGTLPFSPASGHQNRHERKTEEQQLFSLGAVPLWQAASRISSTHDPPAPDLTLHWAHRHLNWTDHTFCEFFLYHLKWLCTILLLSSVRIFWPNLNFSSRSGSPTDQGFCSWQGRKES
jgi:hypothetical protein